MIIYLTAEFIKAVFLNNQNFLEMCFTSSIFHPEMIHILYSLSYRKAYKDRCYFEQPEFHCSPKCVCTHVMYDYMIYYMYDYLLYYYVRLLCYVRLITSRANLEGWCNKSERFHRRIHLNCSVKGITSLLVCAWGSLHSCTISHRQTYDFLSRFQNLILFSLNLIHFITLKKLSVCGIATVAHHSFKKFGV